MSPKKLRSLLENVRDGETGVSDALKALRNLPFEDLGFSRIDHHRSLRQSFPEVVFLVLFRRTIETVTKKAFGTPKTF